MGRALFGHQEELICIASVELKGPKDETLCLARKTSTYFFFAGVYFRDEGYVLKVDGEAVYYPLPEATDLAQFQQAGALPSPLPGYEIELKEYLIGYSLYLIVGVLLLLNVASHALARLKQALGIGQARALEPLSYGPPGLETAADRFVSDQVRPHLLHSEEVRHQAYTLDRELSASAQAAFVVLTSQRMLFIKTRVGAFSPLLENHGLEVLPRDEIAAAYPHRDTIVLALESGERRAIVVPKSKHLSNQAAFLRDVPRLLAPAPEAPVLLPELSPPR